MSGAGAYDCIIIGAGHNGLTCATLLARAGWRVAVLEAAGAPGGAAITREFAPGYRVSAGAHLLHLMPADLLRELDLAAHGLRFAAGNLPTVALGPGAQHLVLPDLTGSAAGRGDADAWQELQRLLARCASALHPALDRPPPRLGAPGWRERLSLLSLAWRIRRLGRRDMRELLRIGAMCVQDLLDERFESRLLKGALAFDAVLGTNLAPRSPGTVLSLLYRYAASGGVVRLAQPAGGMGTLTAALARAAQAAGAQLRTGAEVARIRVEDDRVCGVILAGGEELAAGTVVSNADPKTTFLGLLGARHLDAGFVRRVSQLRARGFAAKVHLALKELPRFGALSESALRARLLLSPSMQYLESAYDSAKYGELPQAPALEITVPTLADPSLAPAGCHVMSVIAQYIPLQVRGGWESQRQTCLARLLALLEAQAPGLGRSVVASELLTPADLQRQFRMQGGHWHHAELAFDQFFFVRPLPGAAQYRTPLAGLYLCGAGCHPGGGVTGLPGRNAAREILRAAA